MFDNSYVDSFAIYVTIWAAQGSQIINQNTEEFKGYHIPKAKRLLYTFQHIYRSEVKSPSAHRSYLGNISRCVGELGKS